MSFTTLNIEKIHDMNSLIGRTNHNKLENLDGSIHVPKSHSPNYDARKHLNTHKGNAYKKIKELLKQYPADSHTDQVPAVEIVMSASPDWFVDKSKEEIDGMLLEQLRWAKDFYKDDGTLVQYDIHYTETTPHIQAIFAPIRHRHTYKTQQARTTDDEFGEKIIANEKQLIHNPKAQIRYKRENVLDADGNKIIKKTTIAWSAKNFQGNKTKMAQSRDSQAEWLQAKGYDLDRGASHWWDFISGKTTKEQYLTNRKNSDDGINCTDYIDKQIAKAIKLEKHIDGLSQTKKILTGEIKTLIPPLADIFNNTNTRLPTPMGQIEPNNATTHKPL